MILRIGPQVHTVRAAGDAGVVGTVSGCPIFEGIGHWATGSLVKAEAVSVDLRDRDVHVSCAPLSIQDGRPSARRLIGNAYYKDIFEDFNRQFPLL